MNWILFLAIAYVLACAIWTIEMVVAMPPPDKKWVQDPTQFQDEEEY